MKLDIGTLANLIKHSDVLLDLLRGGNTPQTCAKLMAIADNAQLCGRLLSALDGVDQNLRVLKLATVVTADED